MSRIELAEEVADDLERILDYLVEHHVADAATRIDDLIHAISVLEHSPLIGRTVARDKRELVVGRRAHGYVMLYRYVAAIDIVFVLGVRSQRDAGFGH